jgi:hypothetical protein
MMKKNIYKYVYDEKQKDIISSEYFEPAIKVFPIYHASILSLLKSFPKYT